MTSKAAHPVETLRKHATALEAAMTVALADPDKPAVHAVRTTVRRLEAQLELLKQLSALKRKSAQAAELRKRLRKLRRAAGDVRDLDVQRHTLETHPGLPQEAAAELGDELKDKRDAEAKKLQQLLLKQVPRIAGALEQLLRSLGTANGVAVPDLRLIALVERWTKTQEQAPPQDLDDEQLHTIRKVAKSARYMMESAKSSAAARRAAKRYEEEQDAGGQWHDWMDLEHTSRKHFGKKHPLTVAAGAQCKSARTRYVKLLGPQA